MIGVLKRLSLALVAIAANLPAQAVPDHVDITWMSISNMHYEIGSLGVVTDGYISRIPQGAFFGGGGGLERTHAPYKSDVAAVQRVLSALAVRQSACAAHWAQSLRPLVHTGTWAELTGARVIGRRRPVSRWKPPRLPRQRCTVVNGGEKIVSRLA